MAESSAESGAFCGGTSHWLLRSAASLTRKPQAMLVDEKSTSVETVKKEPPFATIEAGNANRTKAKGGSSIWTKKVYHIRVGIANIT